MTNENLVFPDFNHCVVNISATLSQYLGHPTTYKTLPKLENYLGQDYKNIVFMVIDGMGSRILQKNLPEKSFLRQHQIDELTSVFPSTTVASTTSLISALQPAEHGWFAWSIDFNGEVIELFRSRNFYTREFTTDPEYAMHKLPYKPFWSYNKTERATYTCCPSRITSKIHAQHDTEFDTVKQMFRQLHKICQKPEKKFVYAYFSEFDSTMHSYGITAHKSRRLLKKINRYLEHLSKKNPDTLFIVTADHGQTEVKGYSYICDDPEIQICLEHPISLDPRGACFKIKPNMDSQFCQAFQKYTTDFTLFTTDELIKRGTFGEFKSHPEYKQLLGDYIAIGNDSAKMLVFQRGAEYHHHTHLYRGTHTGMTANEMYVPLIVVAGK